MAESSVDRLHRVHVFISPRRARCSLWEDNYIFAIILLLHRTKNSQATTPTTVGTLILREMNHDRHGTRHRIAIESVVNFRLLVIICHCCLCLKNLSHESRRSLWFYMAGGVGNCDDGANQTTSWKFMEMMHTTRMMLTSYLINWIILPTENFSAAIFSRCVKSDFVKCRRASRTPTPMDDSLGWPVIFRL